VRTSRWKGCRVLPARAVFSHSDRRTSSGCAACAMAGTITGPVCEPQGRYAVEFHDSRDLRGASGNPWSHSWSEVGSSRVARELLSLPVASQGRLLAANLDQVREVLITGAIAVFLWTTSAYVHSPLRHTCNTAPPGDTPFEADWLVVLADQDCGMHFDFSWSHLWSHSRRLSGIRSGLPSLGLGVNRPNRTGRNHRPQNSKAREGQPSAGSNPAATAN
jgi:hypothetical protein